MRKKDLPFVKTVRAKGHVYCYFDTGEKKNGRRVLKRLPEKSDPQFGSVYAALLGHRTRHEVGYLTVRKLVDMYIGCAQFEKKAANTQRLYRTYLNRFADLLPTAPAGKVERKDVVTLIDTMQKTPGAANMMRACVSALYVWARRRGYVENRPTDDIEVFEGGEHLPWPDELVNTALDDPKVSLAVHLLYFTAQRISDVVTMRWTQIGEGAITLRQKKTGKDMSIALHPRLAAKLASQTRDLRTILLNRKGQPFTEATLRYLIQSWAGDKGYKIVPHGLRKNAVNALLEAGCSVAQTASVSGQSLQVVEYYSRRRDQSKLSSSAMLIWGGTEGENGKPIENISQKGEK